MLKTQNPSKYKLNKRLKKHLRDLGLKTAHEYLAWCKENGFSSTIKKSQKEVEAEYYFNICEPKTDKDYRLPKRTVLPSKIRQLWDEAPFMSNHYGGIMKTLAYYIETLKIHNQKSPVEFLAFLAEHSNLLYKNEFLVKVLKIAQFESLWIRDYKTWNCEYEQPQNQFPSLIYHLFVKYPIPQFIKRGFRIGGVMEKNLFYHLGAGKSIRSFYGLPVTLTRKECNYFLNAPKNSSINEAIIFAQVSARGGNPKLASAVYETFRYSGFQNHAFWLTVVDFFIKNTILNERDFHPIVDYIQAMKFSHQTIRTVGGNVIKLEPPKPHFSMKKRNPETLLAKVRGWHDSLKHSPNYGNWPWESSRIEDQIIEEKTFDANTNLRWSFTELLSPQELIFEGQHFNHCVASYAQKCYGGFSRIFSLSCNKKKKLTIEMHLPTKSIIQVRGKSNRNATMKEKAIIRQWAEKNKLSF